MHKRGVRIDSLLLVLAATAALLGVLLAGATRISAEVTNGLDPESGAATCPAGYGLEDFESGTDGYRWGGPPIASTIPGVQFVTTEGQDWWTGDWAAGYNGKYPNGAYTSGGQKWAWLGVSQGAGIIDFTEGEASYVSVYASSYSGVVMEAYADDGTFLVDSDYASNNIRTGTMSHLSISRPTADIGYVIVHDSGNYWLIDWLCTDAPGVLPADPTPTAEPTPTAGSTIVDMDIQPGGDPNSINTRRRGTIPVAILSTDDFDATTEVDKTSLTFGHTGDEDSLARCARNGEDVNDDGLLDIVCHFNTQDTGFQQGDTEGILRGQANDGTPIEGSDSVRVR